MRETSSTAAVKKSPRKVAVMIGNGSGHEPAMIDLVGQGLFDANVCGKIFTAPSSLEMIRAVRKLHQDGHRDILILVSSHAGDILNARWPSCWPSRGD